MDYHSPIVTEVSQNRINPEAIYRRMVDTGHCPVTDGDIVHMAGAFGLGAGTMRIYIRNRGLDARLEEFYMTKKFDEAKAKLLYKSGYSDNGIAAACEVSPSYVGQWRKKNDLPANSKKKAEAEPEKKNPATINKEFDQAINDMIADMPEQHLEIQAEEVEAINIIADKMADMKSIGKSDSQPAIQQPSADDFLDEIERLKLQIIFLRGVAIGAGVGDIDQLLQEIFT